MKGHRSVFEDTIKEIIAFLSYLVEACAALVITVGSLEAIFRTLKLLISDKRTQSAVMTPEIRIGLGRWLALGLEFELAGDILRTAVTPSWNDIGKLAAIIVLRTALNYFLEKDIQQYESSAGK